MKTKKAPRKQDAISRQCRLDRNLCPTHGTCLVQGDPSLGYVAKCSRADCDFIVGIDRKGKPKDESPTIHAIVLDSYMTAVEKGWWDERRPMPELIALMHSELSEALEELRNGKAPTELYFVNGKPEGVPAEFADVVIRIADACGHFGIDLPKAIRAKLLYNRSRPERHGGKKF